jgi:probable rRNA maturation factor
MKPSPRVSVRSLQRKIAVNIADLERFGRKAVALCLRLPRNKKTDLERLEEVSILIISNRRMSTLHGRFMNEAGPTDVISFQHGEIFISAEMAKRNARRFGNSLAHELRLYIVHGLLHLHGFDDRDAAGARAMAALQQRILAKAAL